jgi:hypothetical protein
LSASHQHNPLQAVRFAVDLLSGADFLAFVGFLTASALDVFDFFFADLDRLSVFAVG